MSHQSELISEDILAYLGQHERKELLRFLTCGNVDDGKSTLIGRLLHDSKMIYEDHMEAITRDSKKSGTTGEEVDLALLVDGLQAEREQGITIDVAYRYFSTAKRKFIIADTPGHEQYTRNMATGASTCDLAIILIDARYGVQTQTCSTRFAMITASSPAAWKCSMATACTSCRCRRLKATTSSIAVNAAPGIAARP
jgi:bifunctional enzyme CysN/CysC